MATSQERLRVVGEAVVAIEPLDVPDEGAGRDQAERSASCQLLAQLEAIGRSPVGDDDWLAVAGRPRCRRSAAGAGSRGRLGRRRADGRRGQPAGRRRRAAGRAADRGRRAAWGWRWTLRWRA